MAHALKKERNQIKTVDAGKKEVAARDTIVICDLPPALGRGRLVTALLRRVGLFFSMIQMLFCFQLCLC